MLLVEEIISSQGIEEVGFKGAEGDCRGGSGDDRMRGGRKERVGVSCSFCCGPTCPGLEAWPWLGFSEAGCVFERCWAVWHGVV